MEQTPGAGVVTENGPREVDSREIAIHVLMGNHRLTEAEILEKFTESQLDACAELLDWYHGKDDLLIGQARDCPACWGGNFRVGHEGYVSEEVWESVLPTDLESSLYYAVVASLDTDFAALDEVAAHREDEEWLAVVARDYIEDGNAEVYYTEFFPDDYTPDEQHALAEERPDLFTAEEIEGLADLIDPRVLEDGGLDLDEASNEMRGIADGLAARQVESPGLDGRDR